MGYIDNNDRDEEYSVISDKGDIGFLDFEDDKSLLSFSPFDEEGPVVITRPFQFVRGKPLSALIGETVADAIKITNNSEDSIDLWSVRIFSENPEGTYLLSLMKPPSSNSDEKVICDFVGLTTLEDRVLQPGQKLMIWLSCKPKEIGLHTAVVHFDVGDEKVERVAFLLAEDKVSQSLFSSKPYSRAPSRGKKFNFDQYVPGSRPTRAPAQGYRNRLPQFGIPKDIREIIESKQIPDVIMEGLDHQKYAKYFSTLIVMEEIHLEEEMRAHNMECVTMKRRGYLFLSLEVPGLAERRPSLVFGDFIFAQPVTDDADRDACPYQGYIHRVEADEIFLKFDKDLHARHRDSDIYNVSFTYNRMNVRRLYLAIHAAENLGPSILFPSGTSGRRVIKTSSFVPLNPRLNKEQTRSVEIILGCRGGEPYVIYGPPGTGKTMTLVEAILQIYATREKARILVCAASNSAADHILEKLLGKEEAKVRDSEVFRLNATSRPYGDINPDYIRFCFFDDMVFKCPPINALWQYRIIISTYMSASLLHAEGIRKGHFSHIFLDEAGQASEPETMVPISNMCVNDTTIVLAGDPKQLGPVIYSRDADRYGLGKSYMERLFECEHYESGNENYVTKLVRNYRSHPAVLELPSKLFYKGELIACTEDDESSIYNSFDLPNKAFPVLFVGIQGCDEREGRNPSWFNRIEASKVVEIIKKLMSSTDLDEGDIGVITPYRQQVLKLKKALDVLEIPDVKVGSVEQFQGQERKVIIISTVRSTVKHNEFDRVHNLGFLSNPRRFNVSITRAKSLLIIVGNPHILTKDPHWDRLFRYCVDNGSYQGCPLPPPENHYFEDEGTGYDDGEDIQKPYANGDEWANVPQQYTNEDGWNDSSNSQYNFMEEGGDTSKLYAAGTECNDASAVSFYNRDCLADNTSRSSSNDVGYENVPSQYNKAAGCGEDYVKMQATGWGEGHSKIQATGWGEDSQEAQASRWGEDRPKVQATGWGEASQEAQATGWDDMPPASGWENEQLSSRDDLFSADMPEQSRWDDGHSSSRGLPLPPKMKATGWGDEPEQSVWGSEHSRSTGTPLPPKIQASGWGDLPLQSGQGVEHLSSRDMPFPPKLQATGWDDLAVNSRQHDEHSSSRGMPSPPKMRAIGGNGARPATGWNEEYSGSRRVPRSRKGETKWTKTRN